MQKRVDWIFFSESNAMLVNLKKKGGVASLIHFYGVASGNLIF